MKTFILFINLFGNLTVIIQGISKEHFVS